MASSKDILEGQVRVLDAILNWPCNCEWSRCGQILDHIRKMKFEFECKLEGLDDENTTETGD